MALARYSPPSNPLKILEDYFQNHPIEITAIRESAIIKLREGNTYRVFDAFPLLISPFELDNQVSLFRTIHNDVTTHSLENENVMRALSPWNETQLKMNTLKIAIQGCQSLIDSGKPSKELIKLLGWEEYKSKITAHALLSAFVGTTFNNINLAFQQKYPKREEESISAIMNYISKNYHHWVDEALQRSASQLNIGITPSVTDPAHQARNTAVIGGVALAVIAGGLMAARRHEQAPARDPSTHNRYRK